LTVTGSITKSQEALNTALNISAATGKSVEQVSAALTRAYSGNTTGLSRLGAGISKATLKAGKMEDILAELNQKFEVAASTLKNRERLILTEIKQSLSFLALKQVVNKLENEQESGNWTKRYIDENIEALKNLNLKDFKK
jgi:hypothetical protein